uniref:Uncharacterized protein n=1 Tax=Rhizophora mucronata TaxID=61149 RepID=A0A2P2Q531_RHIMU
MGLVLVNVEELDYVGMRREKLENLGFRQEAVCVDGITGGKALLDRLDGEDFAGRVTGASANDAESSAANLVADTVVFLENLSHYSV